MIKLVIMCDMFDKDILSYHRLPHPRLIDTIIFKPCLAPPYLVGSPSDGSRAIRLFI